MSPARPIPPPEDARAPGPGDGSSWAAITATSAAGRAPGPESSSLVAQAGSIQAGSVEQRSVEQRPVEEGPGEAKPIQDFEANGFPLDPGLQLLEASAGTGKTFALAHLVLRLVAERRHRLPELLVVTFTEAAAAELRDRIARRLQEGLAALEAPDEPGAGDPSYPDDTLAQWHRAQNPDPQAQWVLRARLLEALEDLDRSDITTIHGFCRRSLQRQALEAGLGPAVELESDDSQLQLELVHEYWQGQLLALPPELLGGLQERGLRFEHLVSVLKRLDSDPALELDPLPPEINGDQPLGPQLVALWPQLWQRFVGLWRSQAEALEHSFCSTAADLRARFGPKAIASACKYSAKPRSNRVQALAQWLSQWDGGSELGSELESEGKATLQSPAPSPAALPGYRAVLQEKLLREYFHPGPFTRMVAPYEDDPIALPQRPLLEAIAALVDGPLELTLLHFGHWARGAIRRRRQRSGRMGFAQLLEGLDPGPSGQNQGALMAALRQRYRVALVDEFQDTDPIQWRILERAFLAEPGAAASHLVVLVGDPKQAIYRFRGGDLATYQRARQRADGLHGLRQNRRSSRPLVQALNALMAPGLPLSQLEVPAVESAAAKGELLLEPGEQPLQLLPLDGDQLADQVAGLCLQLLQRRLLLRDTSGAAGSIGKERPLSPGDLCLLVGKHREAELLRQALERRGLPSRLVSVGDVFASAGATALQRLLDALADPGSSRRLRLLAASPLVGWSAAELAEAEPGRWDGLAATISRLAMDLPRQGLLASLAQLLDPRGLARLALGGRLLADLMQVAELVQERMHRDQLGAGAAADWLRSLRLAEDRAVPANHQLNSDAAQAAIAVVTVHRSKGLEYPVVICPTLWQGQAPIKAGMGQVGRRWQPATASRPRLDLHLDPHWGTGRQASLQDQAAQAQERERLAYVAATRARHLLVLGFPSDPSSAPGSAPATATATASAKASAKTSVRASAKADGTGKPAGAIGAAASPLLAETAGGATPETPRNSRSPAPRSAHNEGEGQAPTRELSPRELATRELAGAIGPWLFAADGRERDLPLQRLDPSALPELPGRWQAPASPETLACGPVPRHRLDRSWGRSSYSGWTHGSQRSLPPEVSEEGREADLLLADDGPAAGGDPLGEPSDALVNDAVTNGALAKGAAVSGAGGSSAAASGDGGNGDRGSGAELDGVGADGDPEPAANPGQQPAATAPEGASAGADLEGPGQAAADAAASPAWSRFGPLSRFPRGAGPGDALHHILEQVDFQQPGESEASTAVIRRELARAGLAASEVGPVQQALDQLRHTPLGGPLGRFCLAELPASQRLNEMGFDLPLAVAMAGPPEAASQSDGSPEGRDPAGETTPQAGEGGGRHPLITSQGLAQVFASHPGGLFGAPYARELQRLSIASRGFLTGSIDLVCCVAGRWWVIDWKSNWLGERDPDGQPSACGPAHYGQAAMAAQMRHHHYPLQAHLYLVALHRYLRWRLGGYDPANHLGGYAYLFLRGLPGPTAADPVPGCLVERPPLGRVLALDRLLRRGTP